MNTTCLTEWKPFSDFLRNVENNKLEGSLPDSLNRHSLEVRYGPESENNIVLPRSSCCSILIHQLYLCRTSGNLCLSFSTMTCNDVSSNPSIETPQVTIVTNKKRTEHNHIAIIFGASGGALLAVFLVILLLFLYARKRTTDVPYTESMYKITMLLSTKLFCSFIVIFNIVFNIKGQQQICGTGMQQRSFLTKKLSQLQTTSRRL